MAKNDWLMFVQLAFRSWKVFGALEKRTPDFLNGLRWAGYEANVFILFLWNLEKSKKKTVQKQGKAKMKAPKATNVSTIVCLTKVLFGLVSLFFFLISEKLHKLTCAFTFTDIFL